MPYIKNQFIDKIREQADIADVIGRYAGLKKKGKHLFCLSPFTDEKTASFCVDETKQRFVDYSTGRSGDVISFLMEKESFTYPEAIEWLAKDLGYHIEYEDAEWAKKKEQQTKKKEDLRPFITGALRHYNQTVSQLPEDHPAMVEIQQKRQYPRAVIAEWEIGFAPGGRFIYDKLLAKGILNEGKDIFLVGDKADKYWNRIIYPIHDANGLLIGLAGRDVTGDKKAAKWINPTDNVLYKKDKTWFALHRAKEQIRSRGEVWIVEGYNDVIAWHRHGLENTVAPCGTSITDNQIKILTRYCGKVVFCMDGDKAGMRSMVKYIPKFLKAGFVVDTVLLPDVDPDDFVRLYKDSIPNTGLHQAMSEDGVRINGFKLLLNHHVTGDELERAKGAKLMIDVVADVDDESYQEIYLGWIAKESGISRLKINSWFKSANLSTIPEKKEKDLAAHRYLLPDAVTGDIKDYLEDIEKYSMFMAKNQIWMMTGKERPYTFVSASNFSIEIIQHMQDEKLPMKLVKIRNIHGEERIFDTPSESLNTPQSFDNAMTAHGNFFWKAGRYEFQRLRAFLFDKMGVGQKIEVLGWQPDKFWVWNNAITIPGEGTKTIDENGVFKNGSACYYIPSANKIYKNNSFKFTPQKKVVLKEARVTFTGYVSKMMEVHRNDAITGVLFTVATMFLDIIEDKLGNFPLLMLYGPASSGKDQLIECCQSFFGKPQSPIHIGNKISTSKAQVRKFAQFRNMIVHLSEYRPGDQMLDELLKGFWDRRGYERGTIDSAYGTETVPVHSSVIFTGNHYPDDDALITRFICEEMTKTVFSAEEKEAYRMLKDINEQGFSSITAELLQHRNLWETKFKTTFRKVESELKTALDFASGHDRMIGNVAVLGATYELMKDIVHFPFSWPDFLAHQKASLEKQVSKLKTASIHSKFWNIFLAAVTTEQHPMRHGREFSIHGNLLYIRFTHVFNIIQKQWWLQYHEPTPKKGTVVDMIKKDSCFIQEKSSIRMDGTRSGVNSSAWELDLNQLAIKDDLMQAVEWQRMTGSDLNTTEPAGNNVPTSAKTEKPSNYDTPLKAPF